MPERPSAGARAAQKNASTVICRSTIRHFGVKRRRTSGARRAVAAVEGSLCRARQELFTFGAALFGARRRSSCPAPCVELTLYGFDEALILIDCRNS